MSTVFTEHDLFLLMYSMECIDTAFKSEDPILNAEKKRVAKDNISRLKKKAEQMQ